MVCRSQKDRDGDACTYLLNSNLGMVIEGEHQWVGEEEPAREAVHKSVAGVGIEDQDQGAGTVVFLGSEEAAR